MPQIKYRLTAHILELRLSAMFYDDMTGLLPTLLSRGCEREANRLYAEAAKQCKHSYEKGIKYKSECEETILGTCGGDDASSSPIYLSHCPHVNPHFCSINDAHTRIRNEDFA